MKNVSDAQAEYMKVVGEVHRRIIDMYYNQGITNMSEIARKVGYSRERVRQIIEREDERRKKK